MQRATEEMFPQSNVVLVSTSLSTPLACDIALYRKTHVVIGMHGAAMTNVMFMRPGTVLVEIVGQYDLRMPPVCGFHGPYSSVLLLVLLSFQEYLRRQLLVHEKACHIVCDAPINNPLQVGEREFLSRLVQYHTVTYEYLFTAFDRILFVC